MAIRTGSSRQQTRKSWSWSMQPLVTWIRVLGIDIPDVSTATTSRHKWFVIVYQTLFFLIHAACQSDIIYFLHTKRMQDSLEKLGGTSIDTTTATWNFVIDFSNYSVYAMGGHLVLLIVIRPRWIKMTQCFQRTHVILDDDSVVRLRKMVSFGVGYIVTVVTLLCICTVGNHLFSGTSSTHRILISFTSTLMIIYPMSAILLFLILSHVSSTSYRFCQLEIRRNAADYKSDIRTLFFKVKRQHIIASDMVDCINHCLGWTLLLTIPFTFVAIVNCSFYVFGLDGTVSLPDIVFCIYAILNLTLICCFADDIRHKANDVIKELAKFKYSSSLLGTKMELLNWLTLEMTHTFPQINANGYFNVGKRLIPQLIGTTFTYFFILYQFETSEYSAGINRPSSSD